ncbi:Glutamate--cysteine ligase regulatory subunit [Pseudolycoriella hygida]|uniref:GCS light chain n=1 Tax=Pseudolycoriella hygida TaxID=35572 RepID=A0A9Q0NDY2_9DIPT|nr:Glutamate--cysteine ligase regulatory subunit [Pseudolycoriella hygida]
MFTDMDKVIISTGNILSVNKKAGQKVEDELFDCLKVTIDDPITNTKTGKVFRNNDDLNEKITEFKREEIKIGAKVFLNNSSVEHLEMAVENLLLTLGVHCLDNLILSFHPKQTTYVTNGNGEHAVTNGTSKEPDTPNSVDGKEGVLEWSTGNSNALNELKLLWGVLEDYAKQKKICQLGIADLDPDSFQELYESSQVKPTIAQINLKTCCVVPPALQQFCTKNEIQLLTHSDPEEIITSETLSQLKLQSFRPLWATRYQVHVRCRGVLTAKGFIICATKL